MERFCTSREQSKRLLELGIDPNTSDGCYHFPEINDFSICVPWKKVAKDEKEVCLPSWSLSALFKLMPQIGAATPRLSKTFYVSEPKERYYVDLFPIYTSGEYEEPIDAAYEMCIWLLENKKI